MQALRNEIKTEVETAIAAAWEAPDPDPGTVLDHVFADDVV